MGLTEDSIAILAATDKERLGVQKITDEKLIGNLGRGVASGEVIALAQKQIATAVQSTLPVDERKAKAMEGHTKSVSDMQADFQKLVANVDPVKADQRDMAYLLGKCIDARKQTTSTTTSDTIYQDIIRDAFVMFDLAWAGLKSRMGD